MNEAPISVRQVSAEKYSAALEQLEQLLEPSVSFLQAPLYGRLQEQTGKKVVYFAVYTNDVIVACGLAVRYTAPFGMNFLYCPYGPVLHTLSLQVLDALRSFFKPIARDLGCAFVRIDPDTIIELGNAKPVSARLARTASLQPRAEWLLDITQPENDLWMGFHKHARYNVRLAERAQAEVKTCSPGDAPLDDFISLMEVTAGRDGFGIFDRSYYQAYLSAMKAEDGFMTICYIDGKPAAAGLFVTHDKQAHYVFAGSSDDNRKIAPAYSVIWSAIRTSQQRGCQVFNFGGVAENVKGQSLAGVTSFKRRFGGFQIDHKNPIDLICSQPRYFFFKLYKTLLS